ncbi:hypothetical protein [Polynucleobacter sp. JS-JIR-5-A7]|uniref:hypothetical protein n=1 Tax=Polynucleobacter sp. JS-JIR-5-A7 TaxID=1758395 RepID=UPI001BFD5C40|nr:hypothetical protein [Polynucleobacter sp. JS-JIR-5-A7]QWE06052.1 hypothetical protein AOC29_07995 [Polynucleobacter sp. JS-JIR-5-A7]
MINQYFMAIFVVETPELRSNGRPKQKTISSYVALYDNFESTVNKFSARFANQDFTIKEITVFVSDVNFKDEWELLKADASVAWSRKNSELLQLRPDITVTNVFCADDFHPRNYRK